MFGLFGRKAREAAEAAANAAAQAAAAANPAVPFPVMLGELLDALEWDVRGSSHVLSAAAFSRLRTVCGEVHELVKFLQSYEVRAEEAYVLEGTVRRHVPEALDLFRRLTVEEQAAGGAGDVMLLEQCDHIERSLRELNASMRARVLNELDSQTLFVEQQFTQPF